MSFCVVPTFGIIYYFNKNWENKSLKNKMLAEANILWFIGVKFSYCWRRELHNIERGEVRLNPNRLDWSWRYQY